ncbi:MAG: recombinase family protein [Ruminococcus flavefaciens]|nr:recombinase family protein [Ruminococcus flavefaciens]
MDKPVRRNVNRFVLYKLVKINNNMEGYEAKLCILFLWKGNKKMKKQKRISFGYTRNNMSEIVIYEEQAEVVKLIFELYTFDQSLSKISKHLEMYCIPSPGNKPLWGRQIINNILSNANYLGDSDYPQIINEELWNAVQNKKSSSSYSMRYSQRSEAI